MADRTAMRFLRGGALAFDFTGTIAGAAVCGWAIDRWFDTEPWGVVVLSLLGVAGAFVRLVQLLRRFERIDRAER